MAFILHGVKYTLLKSLFLRPMEIEKDTGVLIENHILTSEFLHRDVKIDFYFPKYFSGKVFTLLLINDGQDLPVMDFESILGDLYASDSIKPLLCIGIHCGKDRRNEYGTAKVNDYKGRGYKAAAYSRFIFEELIPYIRNLDKVDSFTTKSFCGFSLGGLSAFDLCWENPEEFLNIGVFSGSFWWRTVNQHDKSYNDDLHRIAHQKVRHSGYYPWLKFFFETGIMDETADRNHNGIIDVIDDTLGLIDELVAKGYDRNKDIMYLELADGRHDVPTWGRAFPEFLKWAFSRPSSSVT